MKLLGYLAWALLFWLAGCAAGYGSTKPVFSRQDEAVELVWKVYGRTDSPPAIRWITGSDLDCIDPNSGKQGFTIAEIANDDEHGIIRCREGYTMRFDEVMAAYHGERSIADTAALHELLHLALAREGVFIGHHTRPGFFEDIAKADAAVRAAGL